MKKHTPSIEFPEHWLDYNFGDFAVFPPKIILKKGMKYSFIPMEDITSNIKFAKSSYLKKYSGGGAKFSNGDTLFARITPCLQNGKISQAKDLVSTDGFGSTEYFIFRGRKNISDTDFVYYLSQTQWFRQNAMNSMVGASGRQRADAKFVSKTPLILPPLPTQQKIAQILSAYDDLIENNLKRIKLLEEMAQQTYEEWFVRMKFPNHKTTPIDAETGLPEGWEEGSISSVCHVNNDSITKKTEPENIRYIDIASANTGSYETPQELKYSTAPSRAKRRVKYGDTIFSTVRPNRKIYSCVMENDPFLVASTGFAVLTPKIKDTYSFVYLSVASQSFVEKAVSVAGGAAYPAVNQKDFEKIKITIPNYKLIQSFSELINPSFKVTANLKLQNQHLKEARDILLPRLMTGMIDVDKITIPNLKTSPSESEHA